MDANVTRVLENMLNFQGLHWHYRQLEKRPMITESWCGLHEDVGTDVYARMFILRNLHIAIVHSLLQDLLCGINYPVTSGCLNLWISLNRNLKPISLNSFFTSNFLFFILVSQYLSNFHRISFQQIHLLIFCTYDVLIYTRVILFWYTLSLQCDSSFL